MGARARWITVVQHCVKCSKERDCWCRMFGWGSSKKEKNRSADADDFDMQNEVYQTPLPPTMPVVKKTIDTLVQLAVQQRLFL